eukprot:4771976-Pleurochrysis_carterae.AAC.1
MPSQCTATAVVRRLKSSTEIKRYRASALLAALSHRTDVRAAGAATAESADDKAAKGTPEALPRGQPPSTKAQMINIVSENLVVKVDHATTICIPGDLDQPYCCLNAVLVDESTTMRPRAFHYTTKST